MRNVGLGFKTPKEVDYVILYCTRHSDCLMGGYGFELMANWLENDMVV